MTFTKGKQFEYPSYEINIGLKKLTILFASNGDLYWIASDSSYKGSNRIENCQIKINKENYRLYETFEKLFRDVSTANIFEDASFEMNFSDRQKKLINGNTICWYSDETNEKVANYVSIKKMDEEFILDFHTQKYVPGYDRDDGHFYTIPIRFRNSGSRYTPFNIVFMRQYQSLENVDDVLEEGHQIHFEEYLYELAKKERISMDTYTKFIFDLDYTLLIPDWSKEDDYLNAHVKSSEKENFFKDKQGILDSYEAIFPRYELDSLSKYFKKHGYTLSKDVIEGWMIHNGENIIDEVNPGVIELLEYLKANGKEIVVLTNWFGKTQIPRLQRAGLYNYIDKIVTGDMAMKPGIESFNLAIGDTPKEKCLMIGDSIRSDKLGADNAGIDSYILQDDNSIENFLKLLKEGKLERTRK